MYMQHYRLIELHREKNCIQGYRPGWDLINLLRYRDLLKTENLKIETRTDLLSRQGSIEALYILRRWISAFVAHIIDDHSVVFTVRNFSHVRVCS